MIRNLQSLRFFFILLVFLSHASLLGHSFDFGGECGVSFFFILSGFVLSVGYGDKIEQGAFSNRRFFCKQLFKSYPLHLLMLAIAFALDMRLGRTYGIGVLLSHVFLVQSWVPLDDYHFVLNGVSWFLSDLVFFYAVVAWLYKKIMRCSLRSLTKAIVVVFGLWLVVTVASPGESVNAVLYTSPLLRAVDFALGIVIYRLYASPTTGKVLSWVRDREPWQATLLEAGAVLLLICGYFAYRCMPANLRCCGLFYLIIPLLIYVFSVVDRGKGLITRLLHSRILQSLGSIGLEIYLLHLLVMRLFDSAMRSANAPMDNGSPVYVILCLVVVILVSYIMRKYFVKKTYYFFEKLVIKKV